MRALHTIDYEPKNTCGAERTRCWLSLGCYLQKISVLCSNAGLISAAGIHINCCLFVCLFVSHISFIFRVGARGHTAGRILRRLETEQNYGTYTPCGSKLPPLEACVTLLKKYKKRYRKNSRTRYCASAAGNNRYKPDGFPHPPTTPEGSVSGSRRPGTPPSTLHPWKEFQGCSVEERAGKNQTLIK